MTIENRILGKITRDNSLLVKVDSGKSISRLLFDCGEGCLNEVSRGDIGQIDMLFFSHLHMDHVAGFDSFFRVNFDRTSKENIIWGPPETARIIGNRFQGYMWNHHTEFSATWYVKEIFPDCIKTYRFEANEAFANCYEEGEQAISDNIVMESENFVVEALIMNHLIPSIAYVVREKPKFNIQVGRLKDKGLKPGPWLKSLQDDELADDQMICLADNEYALGELRNELMVEIEGESVAYLTDFLLDDAAMEFLTSKLTNCKTVVCESQYRHEDLELSTRNYHMTVKLVAELAQKADIDELILFHVSQRYDANVWPEILKEAREIFPRTVFPEHWGIG